MTAASELKSAAVVQKVDQKVDPKVVQRSANDESRKRKTPGQKVVDAVKNAVNEVVEVKNVIVGQEVTDARNEAGQTASRKTSETHEEVEQVHAAHGSTTAGATQTVAAANETSGSSAATASKAASMQAIRLPVSVFFKKSRIFPTIQNRVSLRHPVPGRLARADRAA